MKQTRILFVVAVLLIVGTGAMLKHLQASQRLGAPGVKTIATEDPKRLEVVLPERVLDYRSEKVPISDLVLNFLPGDTSFGQRQYTGVDKSEILLNVVLMGADRTSIHKPQFCLAGAGWDIDYGISSESSIRVERPQPYELPVMKLVVTKQGTVDGRPVTAKGLYVYWFVADGAYTAQHWERMWWMAGHILKTGELQRWAYVTCFSICAPGQEEATFQRMTRFIAAAVPDFQTTPKPQGQLAANP